MKLKWCIIFLILIVVVITSLDVLVGYIVKREFHEYNMHYKSSSLHFAIKCEDILMHPDDDYVLFNKNKDKWEWSVNEQGENICRTNSVKDIVDKVIAAQVLFVVVVFLCVFLYFLRTDFSTFSEINLIKKHDT